MIEIPVIKLFENMVERVALRRDEPPILVTIPVHGYYDQNTKKLVVAEGLPDEVFFCAAYAALLRELHPLYAPSFAAERAREKSASLPMLEKRWVVEFLKSKAIPEQP